MTITSCIRAQDAPSGYTPNLGLRLWNEGDVPSADSLNQNWLDIDIGYGSLSNKVFTQVIYSANPTMFIDYSDTTAHYLDSTETYYAPLVKENSEVVAQGIVGDTVSFVIGYFNCYIDSGYDHLIYCKLNIQPDDYPGGVSAYDVANTWIKFEFAGTTYTLQPFSIGDGGDGYGDVQLNMNPIYLSSGYYQGKIYGQVVATAGTDVDIVMKGIQVLKTTLIQTE